MSRLIAIVGNTGVGKSQLAVELAKSLNGEVINADSMQVYKDLDAITNKHPIQERQGVPHHLLGHVPWTSAYTIGDFESEVLHVLKDMDSRGKLPIVVGGTHYYIQALLAENTTVARADNFKPLTDEQKQVLDSPEKVEAALKEVDPEVLSKFHPNDTRRLRRALEIYYTTGQTTSSLYREQEGTQTLRRPALIFWLHCEREELIRRLDSRVDTMWSTSLEQEIQDLHKSAPLNKSLPGVYQVIGYRQFLKYLDSPNSETLSESLEAMKAETRQYAKKQTKFIVNKLLPTVEALGARVAVCDSTNLAAWQTSVAERALKIAAAWNTDQPLDAIGELLIPSHIKTERVAKPFTQDQWIRHKCEVCSVNKEVILLGDQAWDKHKSSKGHRKMVERAGRLQRLEIEGKLEATISTK